MKCDYAGLIPVHVEQQALLEVKHLYMKAYMDIRPLTSQPRLDLRLTFDP